MLKLKKRKRILRLILYLDDPSLSKQIDYCKITLMLLRLFEALDPKRTLHLISHFIPF